MKLSILAFVLILACHSSIKANDISEFKIDDLSIGDSLLEIFSKDKKQQYKMLRTLRNGDCIKLKKLETKLVQNRAKMKKRNNID